MKDRGAGSYLKPGGQVVMQRAATAAATTFTNLPKPRWATADSAHPSPAPLKDFKGMRIMPYIAI